MHIFAYHVFCVIIYEVGADIELNGTTNFGIFKWHFRNILTDVFFVDLVYHNDVRQTISFDWVRLNGVFPWGRRIISVKLVSYYILKPDTKVASKP